MCLDFDDEVELRDHFEGDPFGTSVGRPFLVHISSSLGDSTQLNRASESVYGCGDS
jgi:hypothetical protein